MNQNLTIVTSAVHGQYILNMYFVDPYVQMVPNWSEILHDTPTQNIINIYLWKKNLVEHVLVGVNPYGKVRNCGTAASNYKAS